MLLQSLITTSVLASIQLPAVVKQPHCTRIPVVSYPHILYTNIQGGGCADHGQAEYILLDIRDMSLKLLPTACKPRSCSFTATHDTAYAICHCQQKEQTSGLWTEAEMINKKLPLMLTLITHKHGSFHQQFHQLHEGPCCFLNAGHAVIEDNVIYTSMYSSLGAFNLNINLTSNQWTHYKIANTRSEGSVITHNGHKLTFLRSFLNADCSLTMYNHTTKTLVGTKFITPQGKRGTQCFGAANFPAINADGTYFAITSKPNAPGRANAVQVTGHFETDFQQTQMQVFTNPSIGIAYANGQFINNTLHYVYETNFCKDSKVTCVHYLTNVTTFKDAQQQEQAEVGSIVWPILFTLTLTSLIITNSKWLLTFLKRSNCRNPLSHLK